MNSKITLKPLSDKLVLEQVEAETKSAAGIILPSDAQEKPKQAKVLAVGSDVKEIKPGDVVLYKSYGPDEVKVDGAEYLIAKEEDILAIVENSNQKGSKK